MLARIITRMHISPADINRWVYSWEELYEMNDQLDLLDWVEHEGHVSMKKWQEQNSRGGR